MVDLESLDRLVYEVRKNERYQALDLNFVQKIAAQELSRHKHWKDVVKATRGKLHQVGGAYLDRLPDYTSWKNELAGLPIDGNDPRLQTACRRMLQAHTSTRERLPILEEFFSVTLEKIRPVTSVVDLACGLTPLCAPWMPLAQGAYYAACDIYPEMVTFDEAFLSHLGYETQTWTCDLTQTVDFPKTQLALLLKTLPCLEQVEKGITQRLMEEVPADTILVSFPVHSLGGRAKGMAEHYGSAFREQLEERQWAYEAYEFPGELAFLVYKNGLAAQRGRQP